MTRHRMMVRAGLLLSLFVLACLPTTATVTPADIDALNLRLDLLFARLEQLDTTQQSELLRLRADLSNQLASNNEKLEVLSAKLDDYAARLTRTVRKSMVAESASGTAPASSPTLLYDQALADYYRGRYEIARQGFGEFLKRHADHELSDNAQYWLGECWYSASDFTAAQAEFQKVVERFPDSDKAPAAMLKIALCLENTGRKDLAAEQYRQLIARYPHAQEVRTAEDALRRLK